MARSLLYADMKVQTRDIVRSEPAAGAVPSSAATGAVADKAAFLALSSELTGFDRFDLVATGLVDAYLAIAINHIGPETWQHLFVVWKDIAGLPPEHRVTEVSHRIMSQGRLADVAKRIIALWYVGGWYSAPPAGFHTVSSAAYVEGLVWKAMRTHPMGAKPQGYAAWTTNPPSAPLETP
jgi:hypothetical protein